MPRGYGPLQRRGEELDGGALWQQHAAAARRLRCLAQTHDSARGGGTFAPQDVALDGASRRRCGVLGLRVGVVAPRVVTVICVGVALARVVGALVLACVGVVAVAIDFSLVVANRWQQSIGNRPGERSARVVDGAGPLGEAQPLCRKVERRRAKAASNSPLPAPEFHCH